MTTEEMIKILEEYEIFVDDDWGGSYKSIIAYAPGKTLSRNHTPTGVLKIIDAFEKIQKENQKLKEQLKASEKARKKTIEYLKGTYEMAVYSKSYYLDKENIDELLEILDIDKGE